MDKIEILTVYKNLIFTKNMQTISINFGKEIIYSKY